MEWNEIFRNIKSTHDFSKMESTLEYAYESKTVYPPRNEIYSAFELTPFKDVKVVIIGQDPYHGPNQAHGLAFSVNEGVPLPPSLRNIYKELYYDLNIERHNGSLKDWAREGVLLLNSTLTVEAHEANSHKNIGWSTFTDEIIRYVSTYKAHVVFVLWGNFAQKKESLIDASKHSIIKSVHPSPLSASRGFFGSKPFSQINAYLNAHGQSEIHWGNNE